MYLWEVWRGRNHFVLNGWLLCPSQLCPSLFVTPVILGIIVFFCVAELPRLEGVLLVVATLAVAFAFNSLYFFVRLQVSDPGVLPRREMLPLLTISLGGRTAARKLVEDYCGYFRIINPDVNGQPVVRNPEGDAIHRQEMAESLLSQFDAISCSDNPELSMFNEANDFWKNLFMDTRLQHLKFCRTCKIKRPLKSSHCRYCDNCVVSFDHHCFWVGHCVGARNHRVFICFLLAAGSASAMLAVISLLEALQTTWGHGLPYRLYWSDWRIIALGILMLMGAGFFSARFGLRQRPLRSSRKMIAAGASAKQAPAPSAQVTPRTQKVKAPFLSTRDGQRQLKSATSVGLACVVLGCVMILATLLPWQPLLTIALTVGPTWLVSVSLQVQLGVIEGQAKRRKEKLRQGLARLLIFFDFLTLTPSPELAPMLAEIDERWLPPKPIPDEKTVESSRSSGFLEAARHTALLCERPEPAELDVAELGQVGTPALRSSSRFSSGGALASGKEEADENLHWSRESTSRSQRRSGSEPLDLPANHDAAAHMDDGDSESSLLNPENSVKRKDSWIIRAGSGDEGL